MTGSLDAGGAERIAGLERKWWVLISIGVGTYMSALDSSIVNTVLPVIERAFGADVATIEWVITTYLLVISGLLLSFGRLGDLRSHKRVYVGGFLIFVLGSAVCGAAPSAAALIGFRALQGIGAAMIYSNSPAILTANFPAEQRGRALGLQATLTYLGLTTGPVLGGWLTHAFSWRAIFYVNVPVGLLAFVMAIRFIPKESRHHAERFDLAGAGLFVVAMGSLLIALDRGHAWGWGGAPTLALLATFALVFAGFCWLELRRGAPMLDLHLFKSRTFAGATGSALINYICLFAALFLLPFFLIQGRGFDPARTGLLLTVQPLVMAVAAPISGALSDRVGTRWPAVVGMLGMAAGEWALSTVVLGTPIWKLELFLALLGLGTGVFISPNNSALLGAAPKNRQGIASGVLATARNAGMVLGVALAGALFATLVASHPGPSGIVAALHLGMLLGGALAAFGALVSALR